MIDTKKPESFKYQHKACKSYIKENKTQSSTKGKPIMTVTIISNIHCMSSFPLITSYFHKARDMRRFLSFTCLWTVWFGHFIT